MGDFTTKSTNNDFDVVSQAESATLAAEKINEVFGSSLHTSQSNAQLKSLVKRIERLNEDKDEILSDIKDVYGEAKNSGYDVKILRKVIAARKKDRDQLLEEEAITDLYMSNLGMI